jgi:hypothetical protein
MGQTLEVVAGSDRSWGTTLRNAGGALVFDPSDPLDADVWAGGEGSSALAVLFHPTVAWDDAAAGTAILSVAAAQTATLDPGTYRLQVGVTTGGARAIGFDGQLQVLEAPGTAEAGTPYCSYADMILYYDQIGVLANRRTDEANFLAQRMRAKVEIDRMLVLRYDPRSGRTMTRQTERHPSLGYDVPDPDAIPPSPAQLSAYLQAGGLILEDMVREMAAKLAIALVLERQLAGGNAYRDEADRFRLMAERMFRCYQAQIDTSDPLDGVADLLIDRDVIFLPEGTAP